MEKTKLGISVGLTAALGYLLGVFGGYVAIVLVAGYVLLCEESSWLKKSVLKAMAVMLAFSIASFVISLIPTCFSILENLLELVKVHFYPELLHRFFNLLSTLLYILQRIVMIVLAVLAFGGKTVSIPGLDPLLEKYFD